VGNVTVVESMAARLREGVENEGVKGAGEKELEVDCDGFVWDGNLWQNGGINIARSLIDSTRLLSRRNLPLDSQQPL
jgi:hypothetical protein